MRKLLKRVVFWALIAAAVIFLHGRVKQEMEAAAAKEAPEETEQAEESAAVAPSMAVIRVGDDVELGRMEENAEGGVKVTVPGSDGTDTVYAFTDVQIDSWYANAVNFAVSTGLMTGTGEEDTFRPEFGILRESFAAILYRYTKGTSVAPKYRFDDVTEDQWYYDAVNWVSNERLMTGLETGTFGVGEYLTCEQALIGLYRLAGEPETDGSLTDYPYAAKVSEYGRSAVDWAWKNGLITEVECVWYPTQAISRAQVALLLMRYSGMTA